MSVTACSHLDTGSLDNTPEISPAGREQLQCGATSPLIRRCICYHGCSPGFHQSHTVK